MTSMNLARLCGCCIILLLVAFFTLPKRATKFATEAVSTSELRHDFGLVSTNRILEHDLVIPVISSRPVRPVEVVASCSCVSARVPSKWYQPGEVLPVKILLDTRDRATRLQVSVSIHFEGVPNACTISVLADIKAPLSVSVTRLNLGFDTGQEDTETTIFVSNYDLEEWDDINVESDANWISVVCDRLSSSTVFFDKRALECWRCTVRASILNLAPAIYETSLRFVSGNQVHFSVVPVEINVRPEAMIFPGSWYYFDIDSSSRVLQSKVVFRIDAIFALSDLTVKLSDSLNGLLDVTLEQSEGSNREYTLTGRFLEEVKLTETRGTIEITYRVNESRRSLSVPVLLVP